MANVFIFTEPYSDIDYSLVDGRVRSLVIRGETLYDEQTGIATDDWRDKLVSFVLEMGLHIDNDGHGLYAFVRRMQDDGLLPNDKTNN